MRDELKLPIRKVIALSVALFAANAFAGEPNRIREAAEKGDAQAQYQVGMSYITGTRFPGDEAIGVDWIKRAAGQGLAAAQHFLGLLYTLGRFVEKDDTEALKWFQKAADQGNSGAQSSLGEAYFQGKGVVKDNEKALHWIKRAAEQYEPSAQAQVAYMYFMGDGVEQDYVQGVKWANLAAKQGNAIAQALLGGAYINGRGVERNVGTGLRWHRLAAAQGNDISKEVLQQYDAKEKATATLRYQAERAQKYYDGQPRSGVHQPASVSPRPQYLPTPTPDAIPSRGNSGCPYGFCGGEPGIGSSPIDSQGNWVSAGLNGQGAAGGGYLKCFYVTNTGYQFTTSSRSSSCPSPVTVNPETGQVRN